MAIETNHQVSIEEATAWLDKVKRLSGADFPFSIYEVFENPTTTEQIKYLWKNALGQTYEADRPQQIGDETIWSRIDTTWELGVIGSFPEMGSVYLSSDFPPRTEITLHHEGQWVKIVAN